MPQCRICDCSFPNRIRIDGRVRNISNRKYCLTCSPYGQHNTKQLERGARPRDKKRAATVYAWKKKVGRERKKKLIDLCGGGCQRCGYSRCMRSLEFHHTDPSTKRFELNMRILATFGWDKILEEAKKTECVCSNCHGEIEEGLDSV